MVQTKVSAAKMPQGSYFFKELPSAARKKTVEGRAVIKAEMFMKVPFCMRRENRFSCGFPFKQATFFEVLEDLQPYKPFAIINCVSFFNAVSSMLTNLGTRE